VLPEGFLQGLELRPVVRHGQGGEELDIDHGDGGQMERGTGGRRRTGWRSSNGSAVRQPLGEQSFVYGLGLRSAPGAGVAVLPAQADNAAAAGLAVAVLGDRTVGA
jgi:hypothetical protein